MPMMCFCPCYFQRGLTRKSVSQLLDSGCGSLGIKIRNQRRGYTVTVMSGLMFSHTGRSLLTLCQWIMGMEGMSAYCQSTTLCTKLCTSPNISEALLHTLMHCIADSTDCATTVPPPASMPLHVPCLFICLFVYLCHWCTCCLLCLFIR